MEIERTVLSHPHYVVDNPRRLTAAHYADYALYLSPVLTSFSFSCEQQPIPRRCIAFWTASRLLPLSTQTAPTMASMLDASTLR